MDINTELKARKAMGIAVGRVLLPFKCTYLHVIVVVQKPDLGVSGNPASFLLFAPAVYRIAKNDWHRIFFISLGHVRLGGFIGSFQGICRLLRGLVVGHCFLPHGDLHGLVHVHCTRIAS